MLVLGQIPMKAELVEGVVCSTTKASLMPALFCCSFNQAIRGTQLQEIKETQHAYTGSTHTDLLFQNAIVKLTNNTTCSSPIHAHHKLPSLFLGKVNKEIMFRDVLNRKQAFLGNKNINPKNGKMRLEIGKMSLEIVFHNVLNRKETILE
ncbi:unnamed protein product [Porites lobata]|uniref:Uncharacterized protein n=1 Tax=Porites lobata TaxID=104759 RepID=A0ABN8RF35_9CNID|nr:unnamed protein product [Porites lobata]